MTSTSGANNFIISLSDNHWQVSVDSVLSSWTLLHDAWRRRAKCQIDWWMTEHADIICDMIIVAKYVVNCKWQFTPV